MGLLLRVKGLESLCDVPAVHFEEFVRVHAADRHRELRKSEFGEMVLWKA